MDKACVAQLKLGLFTQEVFTLGFKIHLSSFFAEV